MADIQTSLRRLQESIRGLSDASALVGPATGAASDVEGGSYEAGTAAGGILGSETSTFPAPNRRSRSRSSSVLSAANKAPLQQQFKQRHDDRGGGSSRESLGGSSGGGDGGGGSGGMLQEQPSFFSSIAAEDDLRESAEVGDVDCRCIYRLCDGVIYQAMLLLLLLLLGSSLGVFGETRHIVNVCYLLLL